MSHLETENKDLKEEIKDRILRRGEELGVPDLFDRIADETVGITEEEILPFLQEMLLDIPRR